MTKITDFTLRKAFDILKKKNISYLEYISYEQPNYQSI